MDGMHVPLLLSFWFAVAVYVIHCIDESKSAPALVAGIFLDKVLLVPCCIFCGHDRQRHPAAPHHEIQIHCRRVRSPRPAAGSSMLLRENRRERLSRFVTPGRSIC